MLAFRRVSAAAVRRVTSTNSRVAVQAAAAFSNDAKIVYTYCDEAPALATHALLPIIRRFAAPANVTIELSDISVSARILANFPDYLSADQQEPDRLAQLGELTQEPNCNIIKLPNVSASIPQLEEAIAELQSKGYNVPNYPAAPTNDKEAEINARYAKVLGSAVNPVLREGNSDRRVAAPVKAYAQANPHPMKPWNNDSRSSVAHMSDGDFYAAEQSTVVPSATNVVIEHTDKDGNCTVMKGDLPLLEGEVIDASVMRAGAMQDFFRQEIEACAADDLMISLHMKATMMKISDPIIFGHFVKVYYDKVLEKHADLFEELGVNVNNGIGDVYAKIEGHSSQAEVEADLAAVYESRPRLAMVDSRKGITNLHVPSDVIIDASMPPMIRDGGKMWNKDDELEDVKCVIPDRSYARMYAAVVDDCRANGQFDVATMGNVSNVGLMAKKAEEYGSHDKTFEIPADGTMRVRDGDTVIFEHDVAQGDIWRMCQTKDEAIQDWIRLAVSRARATGSPATFWLDKQRAHDASLIGLVEKYLPNHDTSGLDISIAAPAEAATEACTRARAGGDSISVTGNVLRDYLTDLFPILELGTSAKMLSIVPLLKGGGLYETGAGGSAPKHVQQLQEENHLRWDSLGEYLALAVSLEELGIKSGNERATVLGECLSAATGRLLDERKSPSRKVNELDNRGSSFYIAMYWAEEMSKHDDSFTQLAEDLNANQDQILQEMIDCQGDSADIGGYFRVDHAKVDAIMCPSTLLNELLQK
jgi:isocitrate dehydrogenase